MILSIQKKRKKAHVEWLEGPGVPVAAVAAVAAVAVVAGTVVRQSKESQRRDDPCPSMPTGSLLPPIRLEAGS
jgi:hypothetical protein